MTARHKELLLLGIASVLGLGTAVTKPLGLSEGVGFVLLLGAFAFLVPALILRCCRRQLPRDTPPPPVTPSQRTRALWLVGAALLTGDIAADIAMPYLIENFQPWMYAAVIPSELAALALTLWIIARRLRYQPGKLEA